MYHIHLELTHVYCKHVIIKIKVYLYKLSVGMYYVFQLNHSSLFV